MWSDTRASSYWSLCWLKMQIALYQFDPINRTGKATDQPYLYYFHEFFFKRPILFLYYIFMYIYIYINVILSPCNIKFGLCNEKGKKNWNLLFFLNFFKYIFLKIINNFSLLSSEVWIDGNCLFFWREKNNLIETIT